jgi:hypothetical protein
MNKPLMPKATAVWLIENTALTFDQIADFCGMHPLEVKGIADGEVAIGIVGMNPITGGEISAQELKIAESDPKHALKQLESAKRQFQIKKKSRYTPVARRQDKPDAISWFLKNYPTLPDVQISKLIGTTKHTINSIRTRSHWNIQQIRPKDPVFLGLCSQSEIDKIVSKFKIDEPSETKKS